MTLTERRAQFVYDAARLAAQGAVAPRWGKAGGPMRKSRIDTDELLEIITRGGESATLALDLRDCRKARARAEAQVVIAQDTLAACEAKLYTQEVRAE